MFCRPCVSDTPAIPSSPHRKARDRAWSWLKSVAAHRLSIQDTTSHITRSKGAGESTHDSRHHRRRCNPHGLYVIRLVSRIEGQLRLSQRYLLACSPLSFSNVRSPFLPVLDAIAIFLQPLLFLGEVLMAIENDHDSGGSWRGGFEGFGGRPLLAPVSHRVGETQERHRKQPMKSKSAILSYIEGLRTITTKVRSGGS